MMKFERAEMLSMKAHPDLTEKWVQDIIAADPAILGLGDLELRQKERAQPRAGRLDLLLQDSGTGRRYEVELQLGATDETHIIRTLEYWDIERKRYPQYDHCAVLIAEDITSRFLNVIALFNGTIPLIALQVRALKVSGVLTLVFTKVMDELSRGLIDEDEDAEALQADRSFWESKAARETMKAADDILTIVHEINPAINLRYNKNYIGMDREGSAFNFISLRPKLKTLTLELKLPQTDDVTRRIEAAGFDTLEYNGRWGLYKVRLTPNEIKTKGGTLKELIELAYAHRQP